ncbi:MAG TPA: hypothetical protein VJL28_02670 [Gemmatimonadaceae bacterium]|nr:hypothetical protein [Gemmatimonadaceae bacterium]
MVPTTLTFAASLDVHVTGVVVAPASALIAAVKVRVEAGDVTDIVAVDGATETLRTCGVAAAGCVTVTLSPHAANTTAVAAKSVERRTFMKNLHGVKNACGKHDCTIARNMATIARISNPDAGRDPPADSPHSSLAPGLHDASGKTTTRRGSRQAK